MIHGMRWVGLDAARVAPVSFDKREVAGGGRRMSIVMGLDQHRAQITAEWIDTDDRRGAARAGRAGGSRRRAAVLEPFRGQELEVALEATTGWRFVVEELRAGRRARCIWPSRRRPQRAARATRSARRPTARTPGICGSC